MGEANEDYDTPWKRALTRYFPEFMAFYFPHAHAAIDWARGHVFLEQELVQVVRDAALGKRLVDKLVQVSLHGGGRQWVMVHLEVQTRRDSQFAHRVFTYNYRIHDRYGCAVASLALLADASQGWRPHSYGYRLFGCSVRIDFPVVKLNDYADRIEELLLDSNPFALLTVAHLLTRQTRGAAARRLAAKTRLMDLLFERDWERRRTMELLLAIDWMMHLPAELELELWRGIQTSERGNIVKRYVPSWERAFKKEGIELGMQQGMQQGMRLVLSELLTQRFGALPTPVRERLAGAGSDELLAWNRAVLGARTLDEVFAAA